METEPAFRQMWQRLLEEERALRAADRALLGRYRALVVEVARRLAPGELDAALRRDPRFLEQATPEEWREIIRVAIQRVHTSPWTHRPPPGQEVSPPEPAPPAPPEPAVPEPAPIPGPCEDETSERPEPVREAAGQGGETETTVAGLLRDAGIPLRFPGDVPALTPASWQLDMAYLVVLARTGWVAHRSLVGEVNRLQGKDPRRKTGTDDRRQARLIRAGLLAGETLETPAGRLRISRLTPGGRAYLARFGVEAVADELDVLERAHGGARQAGHAGLVCFTAYLARLYGYETRVCPSVPGPAAPDLLLSKGGEAIYVEVEAGSGEVERRMRKWRNLAGLQGFVAIVAPTEEVLLGLMAEARAADCRGLGTSLDFAKGMRQDFWSHRW